MANLPAKEKTTHALVTELCEELGVENLDRDSATRTLALICVAQQKLINELRGLKAKSKEEYDIARGERIPCHVINAHCDHYSYVLGGIDDAVQIEYCQHPDNPCATEGNCNTTYCPIWREKKDG